MTTDAEWIKIVDAQWHNRVDTLSEQANLWRHIAYELAGGDRARVLAAEARVTDKFAAAGRERIGPKLPPSHTATGDGK